MIVRWLRLGYTSSAVACVACIPARLLVDVYEEPIASLQAILFLAAVTCSGLYLWATWKLQGTARRSAWVVFVLGVAYALIVLPLGLAYGLFMKDFN